MDYPIENQIEKPILYIDLDGTTIDSNEAILEAKKGKEIDYVNLPPIKDVIWAISTLKGKYDIYFLSSPRWSDPQNWADRRMWLEKHVGEDAFKKLILTHRKDLAIGDILVDDNEFNGAKEFRGRFMRFGSQEYPNWKTVVEILMK
jgi:5'(3')-deoxyribonucleotidase